MLHICAHGDILHPKILATLYLQCTNAVGDSQDNLEEMLLATIQCSVWYSESAYTGLEIRR